MWIQQRFVRLTFAWLIRGTLAPFALGRRLSALARSINRKINPNHVRFANTTRNCSRLFAYPVSCRLGCRTRRSGLMRPSRALARLRRIRLEAGDWRLEEEACASEHLLPHHLPPVSGLQPSACCQAAAAGIEPASGRLTGACRYQHRPHRNGQVGEGRLEAVEFFACETIPALSENSR